MAKRSLEQRFWEKVDQSGGKNVCWPFRGFRTGGYGDFKLRPGKRINAHRVAYSLSKRRDIEGMVVRHKCDNPICCNPEHLELGSHADNVRDRVLRKRSATGERNGRSKLTARQVVDIRNEYRNGAEVGELAAKYALDRKTIWQVVNRRTWKSVP